MIDDAAGRLAHPKVNGLPIVHYRLTAAVNHKDKLSIILSGYPSQIKALKEMDPGLTSRFPNEIIFDDYDASELGQIFRGLIDEMRSDLLRPWKLQQEMMAEVIGRRIARSAGVEGFGNARDVQTVLKVAKERYYERFEDGGGNYVLTTTELLGQQPDPAKSKAFHKIAKMIGLDKVKENIRNLLTLLNDVWDYEQRGEEPPVIAQLRLCW